MPPQFEGNQASTSLHRLPPFGIPDLIRDTERTLAGEIVAVNETGSSLTQSFTHEFTLATVTTSQANTSRE